MSVNKIPHLMDKQKSLDDDFEDKIMVLDYDSLAQIFMWLPVSQRIFMEKVCRKWKEASRQAWYDIKEYKCGVSISGDYKNHILTQSLVEKILLRCGVYLEELAFSEVCNSSIIPIVAERCKNLTRLEFVFDGTSGVNNTTDYILTFTQLDKLVSIKIQIITIKNQHSTNFPAEIMNYLPEGLHEIHLIFENLLPKSPPIFFNLNKYKNLQSLTIRSCNLDDIIQDISKKSTLVYLDIRESWTLKNFYLFNDLVNLKHIDLFNCSIITKQNTSNVLFCIINTCKYLQHLEQSGYCDIPEPEIPFKNWLNLQNLVYLSIDWLISEDFAINIVTYCKKLKDLTIAAESKAAPIIKLTELENLECLKLYKQKLTKEAILAISNNCKKLKHLEIPYCKVTSTDHQERLSCPFFFDDLSNLQYLEYLDLSCIKKLQDNTIIIIANKCKHLKYLKIEGPNKLTENGFDALTSLENIQELTIDGNMTITNNFVEKLKGLRVLNCRGCTNLTDASIIQVIKNCPDLERLDLSFIDNITLDAIIAADLATKNRKNDIVLHIYISSWTFYETSKSKIESQWLLVEYL